MFDSISEENISAAGQGTSDDALFGGSDDDLFGDDGIVDYSSSSKSSSDNALDTAHGALFQNGSIKIGGRFSTSLSSSTTIVQAPLDSDSSEDSDGDSGSGSDSESGEESNTFLDRLKNTALTPTADATFTIDARPNQILRMYSKFQVSYPFKSSNVSTTTSLSDFSSYSDVSNLNASDVFSVKELFTDFSLYDRAFFRFGLHTVSWGTGFLYSPVSDMINTSSIDIMNYTETVSGSFNLRTQVIFPGTQNALYFYVIPDNSGSSVKLIDTALAAKGEFVLGGWEFGAGAFYKYQSPLKFMLTASGSIKKFSVFGEAVYQYGSETQWSDNPESWDGKSSIFQFTAGTMYMWKDPGITAIAQYYYDGNGDDFSHKYVTQGHNLAAVVNFGKIGGNSKWTASVIGIMNLGKEKITAEAISSSVSDADYENMADQIIARTGGTYTTIGDDGQPKTVTYTKEELVEILKANGESGVVDSSSQEIANYMNYVLNSLTLYTAVTYSPNDYVSVTAGPYLTFNDWGDPPSVYFQLKVSLGGGKF